MKIERIHTSVVLCTSTRASDERISPVSVTLIVNGSQFNMFYTSFSFLFFLFVNVMFDRITKFGEMQVYTTQKWSCRSDDFI